MDHTKEPWGTKYRNRPDGMMAQEIFDKDGETIATLSWYSVRTDEKKIGTNREANARRIVACVNACAGIETEKLESGSAEWWGKYVRDDRPAMERELSSLRSALAEKTAQVERLGKERDAYKEQRYESNRDNACYLETISDLQKRIAELEAEAEQYQTTIEEVTRQRNEARERVGVLRDALDLCRPIIEALAVKDDIPPLQAALDAISATADTGRDLCGKG